MCLHELTFSDVDALPLSHLIRDLRIVCPVVANRLTDALTRLGLCVSSFGACVRFDTRVKKSKQKVINLLRKAMKNV